MGEKADLAGLMGAAQIKEDIVAALKTVYDPEIPVDIYEMGLIYRIDVEDDGRVDVDMTLTSPACPVAQILPLQAKSAIETVPGVTHVELEIVWDPPWEMERMSEAARFELGILDVAPAPDEGA
jgi:FeS assembly SUF system protein